ncbi:MAG: protein translocase subunit SecD [Spirochaetaceae bacterium]|jgi:preprotein translocase subunit SecD|nr:protein translocase subunit SecD [Spirochaetaceae bacterium]
MRKITRFILVLAVIAICFGFLLPSINWYVRTPKEVQTLALGSLEKIKDYSIAMAHSDVIALKALAASGPDSPIPAQYSWLTPVIKENCKLLKRPVPGGIRESLLTFSTEAEFEAAVESRYREMILKAKRLYNNSVKLGLDLSGGMSVTVKADLDTAYAAQGQGDTGMDAAQFRSHAMAQAIDTLRGRIDRFGLTEPVIRQQGEDRIYIELPGAAEADRINSIIMGKGILNFRLVDSGATEAFTTAYRQNPAGIFNAAGDLVDPSLIPADCEVLGLYTKDQYDLDERVGYLVIKKEIALDGKHIKSAQIDSDLTGKPQVTFNLDAEGAVIFGDFTSAHVNENLAIVSDDKIKSYARINSAITGGNVAISGFGLDEAQDLQKVLQTAWLSVPLSVESQQVIGASLGEEAIEQGMRAVVFGLLAVLVFMFLWYLGSGINAVVAQILNLYIMFSVLSALNLTLTLPGIAGMILTIGMAVDANVIVFERIKEELRLGKGRAASVAAGFKNAFSAIMDANITTFIAAAFMSQLGTGSIQGFAVSLAIGVVTSVFTALFVSRLIFDFGTEALKSQKISISWRLK